MKHQYQIVVDENNPHMSSLFVAGEGRQSELSLADIDEMLTRLKAVKMAKHNYAAVQQMNPGDIYIEYTGAGLQYHVIDRVDKEACQVYGTAVTRGGLRAAGAASIPIINPCFLHRANRRVPVEA